MFSDTSVISVDIPSLNQLQTIIETSPTRSPAEFANSIPFIVDLTCKLFGVLTI